MDENILSHFGQWIYMLVWIVLFVIFLVFTPFYKKSQRKPASAYLAFVVALAFEMFGIPLSMYIISAVFGATLPEGILWGHTLSQWIGLWGMYVGIACYLIGGGLVFLGWRVIHKRYWSKEAGQGQLVTDGIYGLIRHPQYTGFLMITFGMLCEWATLPLLIMWPVLVVLYTRLARREEADMRKEFGAEYDRYIERTGMFLPRLRRPAQPKPAAVRN